MKRKLRTMLDGYKYMGEFKRFLTLAAVGCLSITVSFAVIAPSVWTLGFAGIAGWQFYRLGKNVYEWGLLYYHDILRNCPECAPKLDELFKEE